jgi:hypothetical protein
LAKSEITTPGPTPIQPSHPLAGYRLEQHDGPGHDQAVNP